jgi:PAS domain S-box-containing protein
MDRSRIATPPTLAIGHSRLAPEIISAMREPFLVLDDRLRLTAASPAFFQRFGLEESRSLGESLYELGVGEWDTPGTRELFDTLALRRDGVETYTLDIRSPGSRAPRVTASVRPLHDGPDLVVCYLVSFFEVAPVGATPPLGDPSPVEDGPFGDLIIRLGRDHRVTRVRGAIRETLGYRPADLLALPLDELLHPADCRKVLGTLDLAGSGDPRRRLTFRIRHSEGQFVWVDAVCYPPAGDPAAHVELVARDVSESRRSEEALRWVVRQNKLVLDAIPDGILSIDRTGAMNFVNPAAARLLRYPAPDLMGMSYRTILSPGPGGFREAARDPIGLTLHDGLARASREDEFLGSDGGTVSVEFSCTPVRDHGRLTGAVVTFRGIAERKRAEALDQHARLDAAVGETIAAVRSEITNPLTAILAAARLLEIGECTRDEQSEMISSIGEQARRISEAVQRISESRPDSASPPRQGGEASVG